MTKNLEYEDERSKLISAFFKEFKNESLIWTGYIWADRRGESKHDYLEFLNKTHNSQAIIQFLKNDFFKYNITEIEYFLNECRKDKIFYIPDEDLVFLKDQDRLCWFLINTIEYTDRSIRKEYYKYENAYFSLLFLIHIELSGSLITLERIRKDIQILNEKGNPIKILSKYINDDNFIDWALNYTETKYRIRTKPESSPINNKEKLVKFLSYWDFNYFKDRFECEVKINSLKKAWQQKQFRDKGGLKKSYHLPLTKNTKSQLGALAEKMNISEAKVLEKLIEDAYKNEMLDEKGKALY